LTFAFNIHILAKLGYEGNQDTKTTAEQRSEKQNREQYKQ